MQFIFGQVQSFYFDPRKLYVKVENLQIIFFTSSCDLRFVYASRAVDRAIRYKDQSVF